jgi:hypothetical protein
MSFVDVDVVSGKSRANAKKLDIAQQHIEFKLES